MFALSYQTFAMPKPAVADGAVSQSSVFRARTACGFKIVDLQKSAQNQRWEMFDKKAQTYFDLFIKGANALKKSSPLGQEIIAKETALKKDIFDAVDERNAKKLQAALAEFIKVADLKSEYKPGELGQTDSSGYAPVWGTDRQYIYQR
jgi:hypothetical protein